MTESVQSSGDLRFGEISMPIKIKIVDSILEAMMRLTPSPKKTNEINYRKASRTAVENRRRMKTCAEAVCEAWEYLEKTQVQRRGIFSNFAINANKRAYVPFRARLSAIRKNKRPRG